MHLKLWHHAQLVFSSSCTVYGNPQEVPLTEQHPLAGVSPYGRTKLFQVGQLPRSLPTL